MEFAKNLQPENAVVVEQSLPAGGTPASHGTETDVPAWQALSGLTPEGERAMPRQERRAAIRRLIRHTEKMLREALAEHATDPEKDERTYLWEPLPMVCFELGISRRKLSAYSKELTGMAAHEIVDRLRAEDVKKDMREDLKCFLQRNRSEPGESPLRENTYSKDMGWEFYHLLRAMRRGAPDFEAQAEAMAYGFPNAARFRRACVLRYGKTPRQLEFEILQEFGDYHRCANGLHLRLNALKGERRSNPRLAERPFSDSWARARRERPEWLAAMKTELGLFEELLEHCEAE